MNIIWFYKLYQIVKELILGLFWPMEIIPVCWYGRVIIYFFVYSYFVLFLDV